MGFALTREERVIALPILHSYPTAKAAPLPSHLLKPRCNPSTIIHHTGIGPTREEMMDTPEHHPRWAPVIIGSGNVSR